MPKNRFICLTALITIVISMLSTLTACADYSGAKISFNSNVLTVTDAPADSTLIAAMYEDSVLSGTKIKKGSGTITMDFSADTSKADTIKAFLWDMKTITPLAPAFTIKPEESKTGVMYIHANGSVFEASIADNSSAVALYEMLKQGDVTVDMHDYGSFEKVGPLDKSLPTNDEQITTEAGDIILYQGNQITIYYDTNSWNFTRLGKINGATKEELLDVLGLGNVTVTFSLNNSLNETEKPKTLVVYFSNTGTTENIANYIMGETSADTYEIEAAVPYTAEDLAYYTGGRADKEQADASARPQIANLPENINSYDTIFLGYPIWHGQAPKIIYTFLESYDFTGKTIIPFCTSHSSGIGSSDTNLHSLASGADWVSGRRFAGGTSNTTVSEWVNGLGIDFGNKTAGTVKDFNLKSGKNGQAPKIKLNSGYEIPVAGIGTYSLHNDTCVNAVKSALEQGVRLIDTARMYGNEAEVGKAVREFMAESGVKREEIFVITKLYPGSDFSNPEAAIDAALEKMNIGYIDMMLLHHPGTNDVKAYKAIEKYIADGKIHTAGLSNWYIEEIDDFIAQISIKPDLIQNEIHPYYQEQKVIPYMHNLGIAMQAWYPLGGRGYTQTLLNNETIAEIANAHGKSAAQIILRWDLQNGVIVIPGSSNPDHINENISLFDFELTDEEMAKIAALDRNEKHDWY